MRDIGIVRAVRDVQLFELTDHFLVGPDGGGDLRWGIGWTQSSTGTPANTAQTGGVDHPGVLRVTTGAVSANNTRLHLDALVGGASFTPTNFDRFRWVCRIPTITTLTVRLGLMQDVSAASGGTAGAFFSFDPAANAKWQFTTRQASASTTQTDTGANVVANNWYLLEAIRQPSGNWTAFVNAVALTANSATLPTTACAFGALVQTGAAAARNLDLDYCYVRSVLGQLWT